MARSMTVEEREAFLAGVHVGVVSVVGGDGRAPLTLPMWYAYEAGGEVRLITSRDSRKAELIRRAGRISLCVQSVAVPYRYVSVEGEVTEVQETVTAAERRALARRYLGTEGGDRYVESSAGDTAKMIMIRVRPERWLSQDQSG